MARSALLLLLAGACLVAGAAAQAGGKPIFQRVAEALKFKPADTDTILVPTDEAFAKFAKQWGFKDASELLSPQYLDLAARVAAYHVYEGGPLTRAQLQNGKAYKMMEGNAVTAVKSGDRLVFKGAQNSANAVGPSGKLGTSVTHSIDAVLLPPDVYPTLMAAFAARKELSDLHALFKSDAEAVKKASQARFGGTYFAPSNAGLQKYAKLDGVALKDAFGSRDRTALVLYYHATPLPYGFEQLRELKDDQTIASSLRISGAPEPIKHANAGPSVDLWGALNLKDRATIELTGKDILVGGGVMHVIDFPLLPDLDTSATQSIMSAVKSRKDLSHVADVLTAGRLDGALNDPLFAGTMFVPTDKAVEEFFKRMGYNDPKDAHSNEALLDALIGYHLLPVAYTSERLAKFAPFTVRPFTGGRLRFAKGANGQIIVVGGHNNATVTERGIDAGRSVVHVVDSVLLPDSVFYTIQEAVDYSSRLSILANLLDMTPSLLKVVQNPKSDYTFFATDNDAFLAMGPGFVDRAEAENEVRAKGLSYGFVPGARTVPAGFKDGEVLKTLLSGDTIAVKLGEVKGADGKLEGRVYLKPSGGPQVTVDVINVFAGRSVIHTVNGMLTPKTIDN